MIKRTIVALLAVVLIGNVTAAQNRFLDSKGFVPDDSFVTTPLPVSEKAYADIDGRRLKVLVSEVTAISLRSRDDGDKMWGRIAGFAGEKATNDWVESKFRALGLENIHRQSFNLPPQWVPKNWTVTFTGGVEKITSPALFSPTRPPGPPRGGG